MLYTYIITRKAATTNRRASESVSLSPDLSQLYRRPSQDSLWERLRAPNLQGMTHMGDPRMVPGSPSRLQPDFPGPRLPRAGRGGRAGGPAPGRCGKKGVADGRALGSSWGPGGVRKPPVTASGRACQTPPLRHRKQRHRGPEPAAQTQDRRLWAAGPRRHRLRACLLTSMAVRPH